MLRFYAVVVQLQQVNLVEQLLDDVVLSYLLVVVTASLLVNQKARAA